MGIKQLRRESNVLTIPEVGLNDIEIATREDYKNLGT